MHRLNFKVLVNDAVWQRGANERVALPLHGTVHVYPAFYSTAGAYRVVDGFVAPRLGNTRSLVVYVPPSYDENAAKHYPLLVCHDGQNMFNDSTAAYGQSWRAQQTLDGLIEEGGMEELVVVAVYNAGEARLNEYTYSVDEHFGGGKGDAYLDFLEDTVCGMIPCACSWGRSCRTCGATSASIPLPLWACSAPLSAA